jgi:alginate O-acetyltransferase complex protein AlgI
MVFSSFVFLALFLPGFLALYYLCPARHRNWCALAASVVFYAWGAPRFLPVLLASCAADFALGRAIERAHDGPPRRRRLLLALAIGVNLVFFLYFKYANFFVHEANRLLVALGAGKLAWVKVALPVGISFITFHKISYLVDVSRGAVHAARTFRDYLLYILLFPQLIAGPILRYHWMADQLERRVLDGARVEEGIVRFSRGLAKKLLVANPLGEVADRAFAARLAELPGEYAWLGIACYTFQIYFDFSGYSDMALGLGRMMGFEFVENFNDPYVSRSFTDFWRRWHISLSSWMREYLYIPLGGNRVGAARQYLNLWIVFLLSGFWHGASWNFVAWGAWHGLFLTLDKGLARTRWGSMPRVVAVPLTFTLIGLGWVLFRARNLGHAVGYYRRLFDPAGFWSGVSPLTPGEFIDNRAWAMLAVAAALSFAPLAAARGGAAAWESAGPAARSWRYASSLGLLVLAGCALATSAFNPFIYFRF